VDPNLTKSYYRDEAIHTVTQRIIDAGQNDMTKGFTASTKSVQRFLKYTNVQNL